MELLSGKRSLRRAGAVIAALLLLGAVDAATASAQAPPTYHGPLFGDFRSVLADGEGQTVNAADLAAYEATGNPAGQLRRPAAALRRDHAAGRARLDPRHLDTYYKDTNFGSMPGGVGGLTSAAAGRPHLPRRHASSMAHIYGDNRDDVMFGAGYATAEERLFLMDALRRTAKGTLAGLLGAERRRRRRRTSSPTRTSPTTS